MGLKPGQVQVWPTSGRSAGIKKVLLFSLISCRWNVDLYLICSVVLVSVQAPDSVMTHTHSISVLSSLLCHRRYWTRRVRSLCWTFCPSGISILILCDPKGCGQAGSSFRDFPGTNTEGGGHSLLLRIFWPRVEPRSPSLFSDYLHFEPPGKPTIRDTDTYLCRRKEIILWITYYGYRFMCIWICVYMLDIRFLCICGRKE